MKLYQCSVLHITSIYIATRPWFLLTRCGPCSSDIFRYPFPGETVQCFYRSILLHSTLRWTKKQIIFFYQVTNDGRQKMTIFFYCLLIMHFDLACNMWRVLLQWRRKQSEGDKTIQRCLARCLWTVFLFVILKGTVQWIVQIEECLSYICQCSFYII